MATDYAADRGLEASYEELVELAPDGILVHDGTSILAANASALQLAGATKREQLIGQSVALVLDPPYLRAVQQVLMGTHGSVTYTEPVRDTFRRLDGSTVQVEVRAVAFLDRGHPAVHLVIRDVTERLALEETAREVDRRLQRAERAETVGALAGGVAHELNNMMAVILGLGSFVLDDQSVSPRAIADVQEIMKAAERAAAVTQQLLAFSRQALNRPEVVDLGAILRDAAPNLQQLLGPTRHLDLQFGRISSARIDAEQFAHMLQHLVANARDATPDGGRVTIAANTVDFHAPSPAAGERIIPAGRYVRLIVQDDGVGIDPAVQASIFEPFFTTRPVGEGTGMGLAAVLGILAQNDAFITVYSVPGAGATFTVLMRDAGSSLTPRANEPVPAPRGASAECHSVLVVDDEPAVRSVAARLLKRAGYDVTDAQDGIEALELMEQHGPPHLVLTDLRMPRMGGSELGRRIKERWPDVRVLLMSGHSAEFLKVDGTIADRAHFIEKPFNVSELLKRVRTLLGIASGERTT